MIDVTFTANERSLKGLEHDRVASCETSLDSAASCGSSTRRHATLDGLICASFDGL